RINVFPILLPRLRERPEDIPPLARHFAERAADRFGLPFVEPTSADLQRLLDYPWPGNIRELGAVMDRATILGRGVRLEIAKALGGFEPDRVSADFDAGPAVGSDVTDRGTDIARLSAVIKQHLERTLIASHGRIEGPRGAANLLGVNPHTLRSKMRKLGIPWARYRDSTS
ncbi:MAG TPA: sigma-54-dependent Fis family transcriptional regulator, partial [Pirellulaceae bacterium]